MKIIIKTKNLKLTGVLKEYVNKKINSLERFLEEENFLVKAQIEIEKTTLHHKKGPFFRTECQIQLPGKDVRVESVSENLYLSIAIGVEVGISRETLIVLAEKGLVDETIHQAHCQKYNEDVKQYYFKVIKL